MRSGRRARFLDRTLHVRADNARLRETTCARLQSATTGTRLRYKARLQSATTGTFGNRDNSQSALTKRDYKNLWKPRQLTKRDYGNLWKPRQLTKRAYKARLREQGHVTKRAYKARLRGSCRVIPINTYKARLREPDYGKLKHSPKKLDKKRKIRDNKHQRINAAQARTAQNNVSSRKPNPLSTGGYFHG